MKMCGLIFASIIIISYLGAMDKATKGIYLSRFANNTRLHAVVRIYDSCNPRNRNQTRHVDTIPSGVTEKCKKKLTVNDEYSYSYGGKSLQVLLEIVPLGDIPKLALIASIKKTEYHAEPQQPELEYYITEVTEDPENRYSPITKHYLPKEATPTKQVLERDGDLGVGISLESWESKHAKLDFTIIH